MKLFKEIKNLEYDELDLKPLPIDADSKRLAAFTMNGVVIYDFTENIRKKYLKHL